jgi:MFS family permease
MSLSPAGVGRSKFFYGWVILGTAMLAQFVSGPGQTYSVSGFIDPMIEDLELSRTLVSGLYTAGSLTAAATMVLVGRLLDRYGARVMLTAVTVLFGLALLWMSTVDNPVEIYAGFAAIRMLGQGSLSLIPTTLVALWFVRLRGRVMAVAVLGGTASQAAFPPLIQGLIDNLGWREAWIAMALVVWGLLLAPAILLVRRTPESMGVEPDGGPSRKAMLDTSIRAGDTLAAVRKPAEEPVWTLGEAARTPAFWLLMLVGSSQSLIATALVFHNKSVLTSAGIDSGLAAPVLVMLAPFALVGNFATGVLSDKLPNRYLMAAGQATLVAAMLWIFIMEQPWQAFVYGALLGLSGGVLMAVSSVIWANYYGRHRLGGIRGAAQTSMVASAALGPLPFGLFFDVTGSYTLVLLVFLALPVFAFAAALLAKPPMKSVVAG